MYLRSAARACGVLTTPELSMPYRKGEPCRRWTAVHGNLIATEGPFLGKAACLLRRLPTFSCGLKYLLPKDVIFDEAAVLPGFPFGATQQPSFQVATSFDYESIELFPG